MSSVPTDETMQSDSLQGQLGDDHPLTRKSAIYGEQIITGSDWELDDVDLQKITWKTSTHARGRHGVCQYNGDNDVTIKISAHTYNRAGFESCKGTIRHELVHAWQYQNSGPVIVNGVEVTPETDHGASFKAWVDPLDLDGRCSSHYTKEMSDYNYIYECLDCGSWYGKHRLCKSIRQAASGGEGRHGWRYCKSCEAKLHLRSGDLYLPHAQYTDQEIRNFAAGDADTVNRFGKPANEIEIDYDI